MAPSVISPVCLNSLWASHIRKTFPVPFTGDKENAETNTAVETPADPTASLEHPWSSENHHPQLNYSGMIWARKRLEFPSRTFEIQTALLAPVPSQAASFLPGKSLAGWPTVGPCPGWFLLSSCAHSISNCPVRRTGITAHLSRTRSLESWSVA